MPRSQGRETDSLACRPTISSRLCVGEPSWWTFATLPRGTSKGPFRARTSLISRFSSGDSLRPVTAGPSTFSPNQQVILVGSEGFRSSLAAMRLQDLGISGATDLEGGFKAWSAWSASNSATVAPIV